MSGTVTQPRGIPGTEFVPRNSAQFPCTAFVEVPVTAEANGRFGTFHRQAP